MDCNYFFSRIWPSWLWAAFLDFHPQSSAIFELESGLGDHGAYAVHIESNKWRITKLYLLFLCQNVLFLKLVIYVRYVKK